MRRFDYRILIGVMLILGGILLLLDRLGLLKGTISVYWAGILAIGAAIFLVWFFSDRSKWWAAIPGFTLAGLAIAPFLPGQSGWVEFSSLGGIGLGFWALYFAGRQRWWAIIPGGILLSLAATAVLGAGYGWVDSGGVFFVGLGITFILVALLGKMKWAYIPAAILLLIGLILAAPFNGIMQYIWIGLLFGTGVVLVISAFRSR